MSAKPDQAPLSRPEVRQRPVGLVLAAGAGRRLGLGPKALLRSGGRTLIESLAEALLSGGCCDVTVVAGAGSEEVMAVLQGRDHVRVAHNPEWAEGMGSSLRCGLDAIGSTSNVLVAPVDRPGICQAEVERVIAAHRPGAITAAAHRDRNGQLRRGHPVLFDAIWTAEVVAAAYDDVGARELLIAHRDIVALVDCSDLDDGDDIDVPADLHLLDRPDRVRHGHGSGDSGCGDGGDGGDDGGGGVDNGGGGVDDASNSDNVSGAVSEGAVPPTRS